MQGLSQLVLDRTNNGSARNDDTMLPRCFPDRGARLRHRDQSDGPRRANPWRREIGNPFSEKLAFDADGQLLNDALDL
jgi:hypothetical protein